MIQTGIEKLDSYCESVADGSIPVCDYVKQAVDRHYKDLKRWGTTKKEENPYYFSNKACLHYVEFIEDNLKQYEGIFVGKPLIFEPWQYFVFGSIFGWLQTDGIGDFPVRRFREAIIEIPKKQGKSIVSAATALYGISYDDVAGAQVYGLAKNQTQSKRLSYRAARIMVERNDHLKQQFRINKSAADIGIYNDHKDTFFRPLTSKPESTDGLNVHMAIDDETKDWDDFDMYNIVKDGTISMYNSLILNITTAGHDQHSLGFNRRQYLEKILSGSIEDETTFGVIYTIDEGEQERWDDPEIWAKAMPNLGVSVFEEKIQEKVPACRASSFQKNSFLTKHLNVWLDAPTTFINTEKWANCNKRPIEEPMHRIDDILASNYGNRTFAGLDLGSVSDFTAYVMAIWQEDTDDWDIVPMFWVPEDNLVERKNGKMIAQWVREGYVGTTPGDVTDHDYTEEMIKKTAESLNIIELPFDRYKADAVIQHLMAADIEVVPFGQGYVSMSPAVAALERLVLQGKINHGGNPVLKWMMSNVAIKEDPAGNRKFDKANVNDKIDGAVALAMAVGCAMISEDDGGSVYNDRGVVVI